MRGYILLHLLSFILFCNGVERDVENEERYTFEFGGIIENTINSTLNKFKENLTDPISISAMPFDFGEGEALSGGLNFTYIKVGGVKDFVATDISVNILTQAFEIKIALTEITVLMKYWADMVIVNLVPFYGKGMMSISFDEIEVDVQGTAPLKGNTKIKDIVLLVTLKEATFDLNGLLNNPEYSSIISNALTDNFAHFVTENANVISDVISPIIETIINSQLDLNSWIVRVKAVNVLVK